MLTDIFKTVIAMSVAGGVLGLTLMALRPVTSRLFGTSWQYRLWLAVLIVMILPISFRLPEAPSRPADISPAQTTVTQPTAPTTLEQVLPEATNDHMMIVIGMPTLPAFPSMPYNAADLAARIWLIGAALALVTRILLYLGFINSIRKTESTFIEYPGLKNIPMKRTELDSPLVMGLFCPTLLLPENISEEDLGYVLRHEAVHLRRRDLLVKWFAMLVKCVHWFNPLVYMISHRLDEDCEISCDATAALGLDSDGRDGYMRAILNLLEGSRRRARPLTTAMTGGARLIKRRFTAIRRLKKISPALRLISIPLALLLLGAAMFCGGALAGELRYSPEVTPETESDFSAITPPPAAGEQYVYVPMRMVFSDPDSDLHLDVMPGINLLTPEEAELVLNYRHYSEDEKAHVIDVPDDMPIKAVNVSYPTATIIKGVSINMGYSIQARPENQISVEKIYITDSGHLFFPGDAVTVLADDGEKCIVNHDGTNFYAYIDKSSLLYGLGPDVPTENNDTWAESMLGG